MTRPELDDVDRGILHMLQVDARNNTAADIADAVGVAPNTVRNRMQRLEEAGVIQGYHPHIDYAAAGYQLRVVFICTVPMSNRRDMGEAALDVEGVIGVTENLSGQNNLAIEVVGEDGEDIMTTGTKLEDLGCDIKQEWFVENDRVQPFDHFGVESVSRD